MDLVPGRRSIYGGRAGLHLVVVPVILGDGLRLLDQLQDFAETRWTLRQSATLADGSVGLHYARRR